MKSAIKTFWELGVALFLVGSLNLTPSTAHAKMGILDPDSIFCGRKDFQVGDHPSNGCSADFNGDGLIDFVVANHWNFSNALSVFFNVGNDSFALDTARYFINGHAVDAVATDFDLDGDMDLAVSTQVTDSVYILVNEGTGHFIVSGNYYPGTGGSHGYLDVGDLNGDNYPDLVLPSCLKDSIYILINDSNGSFNLYAHYYSGDCPHSVALNDIDSDDDNDVVVANVGDKSISVFLNDENGNLSLVKKDTTGFDNRFVLLSDLDDDGDNDIAISNSAENNISVMLNQGNLIFEDTVYPVNSNPLYSCASDLNGDGCEDLVVSNFLSGNISVLLGNCDGTFQSKIDFATPYTYVTCVFTLEENIVAISSPEGYGVASVFLSCPKPNSLIVSIDTVCLDPRLLKATLTIHNQDTLAAMTIPLRYETDCPNLTVDSVSFWGTRIENWEWKNVALKPDTVVLGLIADMGGGTPPLPPGEGPIAYVYFSIECDPENVYDSCFIAWDTATVQPESQHLLFVDNHGNEFVPYFEPGTTSVALYRPGDANCSCAINIADVVAIINYLFMGGPEPCPFDAGDVSGDCSVDIADAVYLVNYLFMEGPPPLCGCASNPLFAGNCGGYNIDLASHKKIAGMAQLALASPSISKEGKKLVQIDAKFEVEAAGVQLELTYDPEKIRSIIPELTDRTKDLQLFFGAHDGVLKIGIIDLIGEHLIPAGDGALVSLSIAGSATSSLELKKAILVDEKATPFEVAILPKEETSATRPKEFALMQNYPNPFNPETEISYTLPHDSHVKLVIYNVKGQKVKTLVEEYQAAGHKTVRWDGTDDNGNKLASGIYFYRLQAGDFVQSKKMVLMK